MSMSIRCWYSIVRFVPDEVRDECINIGVLLEPRTSPRRILAKFVTNYSRAFKLLPEADRPVTSPALIDAHIGRLRERVVQSDCSLEHLVPHFGGSTIQLTPPRTTLTSAPEEELEHLSRIFVIEDPTPQVERGVIDSRLRAEVRTKLVEYGIWPSPNIEFRSNKHRIAVQGKRQKHEFDVRFSSSTAQELFRCISFDVDNYRDKINAAKIFAVDASDVTSRLGPEVKVASILQPPIRFSNGHFSAFSEAILLLNDSKIRTFNFGSAQDRDALVKLAADYSDVLPSL